jgi:hypothetical protein
MAHMGGSGVMLGVPMCVVSHLLSHANATNTSFKTKTKEKRDKK